MTIAIDQLLQARLDDLNAEARFTVKPTSRTVLGRCHRCEIVAKSDGKVLAAVDAQAEYPGLIIALGRAEADRDYPLPPPTEDDARALRRLKKELQAARAAEYERSLEHA